MRACGVRVALFGGRSGIKVPDRLNGLKRRVLLFGLCCEDFDSSQAVRYNLIGKGPQAYDLAPLARRPGLCCYKGRMCFF